MAYEFWFHTPLTCLGCGATIAPEQAELVAIGLNPQLHGRWVYPGEVMPITVDDFGSAFYHLRDPAPGEPLRALAAWACPLNAEGQWARITFEILPDRAGVRFVQAHSVALTAEEAARAHFADADVVRSAKVLPDSTERDALLAALAPALEAAARDAMLARVDGDEAGDGSGQPETRS